MGYEEEYQHRKDGMSHRVSFMFQLFIVGLVVYQHM